MPETKGSADTSAAATDVARTQKSLLTDDQLADLHTIEDAQQLLHGLGVESESFDDYGTGFVVLEDKRSLIRMPFVILEWRVNDGDMGEFTSAVIMTDTGHKYIVNDGSTGIHEQLKTVAARRTEKGVAPEKVRTGLVVRRGLRVSDYSVEIDGKMRSASTFYLAN